MKKFKAFSALLLLAVMLFGFGITGNSEDVVKTEIDEARYSENIAFLSAIGVWNNKDAKPLANVTRSELVSVAVRMRGMTQKSVKEENPFSDIPLNHKNAADIYTAKQLGLISGYSDNTFRPNEITSLNHVIKVFVSLLGYSVKADATGGYTAGYNRMATELKLTNGIEITDVQKLTNYDFVQLIVNTLKANVAVQTSYGDKDSWTVQEGNSALMHYLSVEERKGFVTGTEYSSLIDNGGLKEKTISIGDDIYNYDLKDRTSLLGYNVIFYVNTNEEKDILYLKKDNDCESITINLEMIKSANRLSDNSIEVTFYIDELKEKSKKLVVEASAFEILNGCGTNLKHTDFTLKNGEILFYNNDDDNRYEVVNILSYVDYVVAKVADGKIYDKYGKPVLDTEPEDKDILVSFKKGTKRYYIEDIKEYDVLSVAADKVITNAQGITVPDTANARVYEIQVSTDSSSGKMTEMTDEYVVVDGKKTEYSEDFLYLINNGKIDDYKINSMLSLYLNIYGKVAGAEVAYDAREIYGYVTGVIANDVGFDNYVKIKVYDWNGFTREIVLAEKVVIDEKNYKGINEIKTKINSSVIGQMIGYRTNNDNLVTWIDTETCENGYEDELTSLSKDFSNPAKTEYLYQIGNYSFSNNFSINDNTIVFVVPDDLTKESLFSIESRSYFVTDRKYIVEAYNFSKAKVAEFVIVRSSGVNVINASSEIGFFSRVYQSVDEDGEKVNVMSVYSRTQEKNYILADDISGTEWKTGSQIGISDLQQGDIVRYNINSEGKMNVFERRIPISDKDTPEIGGTGDAYGSQYNSSVAPGFFLGYPYAFDGGILSFSDSKQPSAVTSLADDLKTVSARTGVSITVYDTYTEKFKVISGEEIMTYDNVKDDELTDLMYVHLNGTQTVQILLVR